ncbi:Inositol-1-monophosphatase [Devosia equisanguinis]|uniref:Inositol-1-monophosphatase n=1 Tax=Devosia equisanguinis TaxID=2490941 RepID=A0A447I9F2_9HYPH|nr:inositol monophosphatase family protein [Devosia equisanguinis]VDS04171.1 Inositol-1-monophosphatase [Devosia equisanguinis]
MTMTSAADIARLAEHAARQAGMVIREAFLAAAAGEALGVEEKHGHADIVTVLDRQSERLIRDIIHAQLPQSRILGEESGWDGTGDIIWYVDPIDGTSNFASGLPFFCVSIAAVRADNTPIAGIIYDPMADEMFSTHGGKLWLNGAAIRPASRAHRDQDAELLTNLPREGKRPSPGEMERFGTLVTHFRAVRRLGSAALQLAYVAVGRAAVNYDENCHPWDIAAGLQLVAASGGRVLCWRPDRDLPVADPMAELAELDRILVTTPGYDVENSVVLSGWASLSQGAALGLN